MGGGGCVEMGHKEVREMFGCNGHAHDLDRGDEIGRAHV